MSLGYCGRVFGAAKVGGIKVLVVFKMVLLECENAVNGFVNAGFGDGGLDGFNGEGWVYWK